MCGIAGQFIFYGSPDEKQLQAMSRTIAHRGPDDKGIYVRGQVGLVHTRLSVIDLAGGHQPQFNRDGTLALVANGEIYNYVEFRNDLIEKGCVFQTKSDSETIIQAYAAYGDEFISHLHGMFAFALYDTNRNRLILVRDRLGIKPLYYVLLPDRLLFASEIKTLAKVLPQPPRIHPPALINFLGKGFCGGDDTIIEGIKRVLPGHAVMIDQSGRLHQKCYWALTNVQPVNCSFEEAAENFDRLIETVMHEHVRSDVPCGLFLSGGVDSSVLLAMLRKFQDLPVRTFSIGYRSTENRNELKDARRMADRFETRHTSYTVDHHTLFRRIPLTIWATDDLMRDYACLPTLFLAENAAAELKVVFTGEGGDEVFAGYGRYRKPAIQRLFKRMVHPGSNGFSSRGQWSRSWAKIVFGDYLYGSRSELREPVTDAYGSMPVTWGYIRRAQGADMLEALPNNLLTKVDRMLMAFGLEGRVPYLDHRMVEFGLSLPDQLKVRSRQGKLFIKRWAESYLPTDHLYRKKRGFHVPLISFLNDRFIDGLQAKLLRNHAIRNWFKPDGIQNLINRHKKHLDQTDKIWSLMHFAIWHHLFIEDCGRIPSTDENPLEWIS